MGELRAWLGEAVIGIEDDVLARMRPLRERLREERAAAAARDPPRAVLSAWENHRWTTLGGWSADHLKAAD
eukprot:gene7517-23925_t